MVIIYASILGILYVSFYFSCLYLLWNVYCPFLVNLKTVHVHIKYVNKTTARKTAIKQQSQLKLVNIRKLIQKCFILWMSITPAWLSLKRLVCFSQASMQGWKRCYVVKSSSLKWLFKQMLVQDFCQIVFEACTILVKISKCQG